MGPQSVLALDLMGDASEDFFSIEEKSLSSSRGLRLAASAAAPTPNTAEERRKPRRFIAVAAGFGGASDRGSMINVRYGTSRMGFFPADNWAAEPAGGREI